MSKSTLKTAIEQNLEQEQMINYKTETNSDQKIEERKKESENIL